MPRDTGLFWEPLDARARERLCTLVATLKCGDPLAPVSVVVPSTYAGLDLRHDLGRQGNANVHLLVPPRLTELLGAPSLAAQGRRPLTPLLEAAAVRAVAAEAQGPLEDVAQHPALHHALQISFRELRHAAEEGLLRLASQGQLRAEVVRLYRLFRLRTDPHYYDREALAQAAAQAVRNGAAPGEVALVEALGQHWTCAVVLGLTGEDMADAPVRALGTRLAPVLSPARDGPSPRPCPVARLVITPDPQQEVRWVLRRLLRAAQEGVPFHRMAVLYRQPAPYAALVREELSLSGVPVSGPGNAPLAETGPGRTLVGLVRLAEGDLPRNALMSWLTGCPIAIPGGLRPAVQPSHWDAVSRRAGVVGGLLQWRQRLGRYAVEMERRAVEGLERGEIPEARSDRIRGEAAAARSLLGFVTGLADRLRPPPDGSGWPEFARWGQGLLAAYLDRGAMTASPTEAQEAALQRIEETLEEMRTLDDVQPRPSLEGFRLALEEALASPQGHPGADAPGPPWGRRDGGSL